MKVIIHTSLSIVLICIVTLFANNSFDKDKLDKYISLLDNHNKVMGSFAIAKEGKIVYEKQLGFASLEDSIRNSADTKFRIGSITKVFTSALIFQLIDEGKITLDTKLSIFFPDIVNSKKISISHLLYHKSGLFSYTDDKKLDRIRFSSNVKPKLLKLLGKHKANLQPGEKHEYSNTNFLLLGFIVESVTGSTYSEVLKRKILDPLGLKDTYFDYDLNVKSGDSKSYHYYNDKWNNAYGLDMNVAYSAGGLSSTTGDLIQFITAIFEGKVISNHSLELMTKTEDDWGRGIFKFNFENLHSFGHNGSIEGFNSHLAYFPKEKVALCQLVNGLNYNLNNTSLALLYIYNNLSFEFPDFNISPINISKDELRRYSGDFQNDTSDIKIMLKIKDGKIFGESNIPNSQVLLIPVSKNELINDRFDIKIKFLNTKDGDINYDSFIYKQSGVEMPYKRNL